MSVLYFDKNKLGNLEYSLQREMLSTDRRGGYMSTTVVCCNTRKYHGLMVAPSTIEGDDNNYVLLSNLDETVLLNGQSFNLAIHRYPGIFEPRGHKYITDFNYTPTPTITYRIGNAVLRKELLFIHSQTRFMIRYTLIDSPSGIQLNLRPLVAFRSAHSLTCRNDFANTTSVKINGGIRCRLYERFPWLHMQIDRSGVFKEEPDWYYNVEYPEEAKRGYPFREDLFTPGYFDLRMEKGESLVFSCSLKEDDTFDFGHKFDNELGRRSEKIDFMSCLRHSARQFIVRREGRTEVVAGYPWFGRWGRDTFISLPGITLTQGDVESCVEVLDTMVRELKNGLFPNMGNAYNSVDAPLWFFWTLQQLEKHTGPGLIWDKYGSFMVSILDNYRKGACAGIGMDDNGLIWASISGKALTWMDAVVDGVPVTARDGYPVEINALWYNAVCYTLRLAKQQHDREFVTGWREMPRRIKEAFNSTFWYAEEGYLADHDNGSEVNLFIRPNQIIACSLEYTMLSKERMISVIDIVRRHLLTPKGLRTLSPRNPRYQGRYGGDQPTRDRQYHQGTVWPWLLEHYVAANFALYGMSFTDTAREILSGFQEDINNYGIGSIAEIYDGDPPHNPNGTISQAWSVGALLRIDEMIKEYTPVTAKVRSGKQVPTKKSRKKRK